MKHSEFETIVNKLYNNDPLPEDIDEKEVIALQESISDLNIKIHSNCVLLTPIVDPSLHHSHSSTSSSHHQDTPSVKLPTFNLGTFSGQPDKWIAFHSLYENTVHKNTNISDIEKFTYLFTW